MFFAADSINFPSATAREILDSNCLKWPDIAANCSAICGYTASASLAGRSGNGSGRPYNLLADRDARHTSLAAGIILRGHSEPLKIVISFALGGTLPARPLPSLR